MTQLVFELPRSAAYGRADFFTSASNAAALGWAERWPAWPASALVVHGPSGAGKTHLAYLWAERAAAKVHLGTTLAEADCGAILEQPQLAIAVDDADRAADTALLHVFNAVAETGGSLLLTAGQPPGVWRPALADLDSRLRAIPAVGIERPDDSLLGAVLAKHFADRQVIVAPMVIDYLVRHMERSFAAAAALAAALDEAALRRGGSVTTRLAARILAELANQSSSSGNADGVT
jgi:chromosomal replication initiation ATPase DnaA